MRNFCRKFAQDEAYRAACLARTLDWAVRDDLFERNNHPFLGPPIRAPWPPFRAIGQADTTWHFIKQHANAIIALPEYQRIQALDAGFTPSAGELDPEIAPAVAAFNAVPGVSTKWSCQGVSGVVRYGGYDILTVSAHQRFASITFAEFPDLPAWPLVLEAYNQIARWDRDSLTLFSTGDNILFRQAALALAQALPSLGGEGR